MDQSEKQNESTNLSGEVKKSHFAGAAILSFIAIGVFLPAAIMSSDGGEGFTWYGVLSIVLPLVIGALNLALFVTSRKKPLSKSWGIVPVASYVIMALPFILGAFWYAYVLFGAARPVEINVSKSVANELTLIDPTRYEIKAFYKIEVNDPSKKADYQKNSKTAYWLSDKSNGFSFLVLSDHWYDGLDVGDEDVTDKERISAAILEYQKLVKAEVDYLNVTAKDKIMTSYDFKEAGEAGGATSFAVLPEQGLEEYLKDVVGAGYSSKSQEISYRKEGSVWKEL